MLKLEQDWANVAWNPATQDLKHFHGDFKDMCRRHHEAGMIRADVHLVLKLLSVLPSEFRVLHHKILVGNVTQRTVAHASHRIIKENQYFQSPMGGNNFRLKSQGPLEISNLALPAEFEAAMTVQQKKAWSQFETSCNDKLDTNKNKTSPIVLPVLSVVRAFY